MITDQILINDRQQQLLFPSEPRLEVFKALEQKRDRLQEHFFEEKKKKRLDMRSDEPAGIRAEPGHRGSAAASSSAPALVSTHRREF